MGFPESKNEVRPMPHSIHENQLKMGQGPKYKKQNQITVRRKHRDNASGHCLGNGFSAMTPKAQTTEEEINWTSLKLKTFVHQRNLKTK